MICRSWHGIARESTSDAYLAHLRDAVVPRLNRIDGFRGIDIMRRPLGERVEYQVHTYWDSIASIREFSGDSVDVAVVPAQARALLDEWDDAVQYFEVVNRSS